jgi:hypothetical protein
MDIVDLIKKNIGDKMRSKTSITILGLVLLFGSAVSAAAQVTRVQMHIGGYLCGN